MGVDYKLLIYWWHKTVDGKYDMKFDVIHDFIAYKLPHIDKGTEMGVMCRIFKNYIKDRLKFDQTIKGDKTSKSKKKEIVELDETHDSYCDYDFDYNQRVSSDEDNIRKIEIIISYIKKLPTHERELFKQYYLNKVSTRKLAKMYDTNYLKIHKKVKKYKDDINSMSLISDNIIKINSFIINLESKNWVYDSVDALKIAHYHIILFKYKDKTYDKKELTIYQMIEDIKNEIK